MLNRENLWHLEVYQIHYLYGKGVFMALFGEDTLEDKVKKKLIYDAQKTKKSDAQKKFDKKIEDAQKKINWKIAKATYEAKRDEAVNKIADRMMQTFEMWNKYKRELINAKTPPDKIEEVKKQTYDQESEAITVILASYDFDISTYIQKANELNPPIAKTISYTGLQEAIKTMASDKFHQLVKVYMELAKKLAMANSLSQLGQFDTDKINQQLADIPLKIDETIDSVKEKLDILLGKLVAPVFQPELPEFDINAIIGLITSFLNPVLMSTAPLTAVVGNIPIIGDIAGLLGMMSSKSGPNKLTKEEIKKLIPKKPELDPTFVSKLTKIKDDIIAFCMTLPTILIQVIFAMIDVIYSKLNIITSVIPLGGMFPLSLLPAAIEATPLILKLIKVLPGLIYDCVKGLIMDKLAEAMALAMPKPNFDPSTLAALAEDINEQKPTKKSKAKKKRSYSDVTKEIFESKLKQHEYTLTQVRAIQKNYLKIYNGTDTVTTKITMFVDNGKEQVLPSAFGNSLLNLVPGVDSKPDETKMEPGFTETQITRSKPSVDDYEAYLNKMIASSDLPKFLKYEKIVPVSNIAGEWYQTYQKQFEKYGNEVVLEDKLVIGYWANLGKTISG